VSNFLSPLDFTQVLRSAYDDAKNRIRVDAEFSATIGTIEVIIDHTNDSIRLGDGTDLVTTTTVGSDVGLDVNIINGSIDVNVSGISIPVITNISIPTSGEFSHVFPSTTKQFLFQVRGGAKSQIAFVAGDTVTKFYTVRSGSSLLVKKLDLTTTLTLYFKTPNKTGDVAEIFEWS
jgi:hypothetical protein